MESLKQDPKGILPSGRWSAFEKDPKDDQKDRNAIFLPIADIFNKVVDAIIVNSELATDSILVQFLHKPAKPRVSRTEKNATEPHACLMLKQRLQEDVVSWADVLLPCQYKRKDREDELYNVSIGRGL